MIKPLNLANKLALGTVQFGMTYGIANQQGQVSRLAAREMLDLAKEHDIDTLDTAIAYGDSEVCLGEICTEYFKLITKLPAIPAGCNNVDIWIKEQIQASLDRLRVTKVYALLLHRPDQLLGSDGESIYHTLKNLKSIGVVNKIGISVYAPNELELITNKFNIDIVQVPFNLIDRRLNVSGWLNKLKDMGIEIHVRSVFLQGLLLMPKDTVPAKFSQWGSLWERWHSWLAINKLSAVQACLAYPLSFPEIDRVVVGVDSLKQLKQIIDAATSNVSLEFPNIQSFNENLINPANWSKL
jgi:aryl-alcohol dehydrogenase-like predicted oxidoreductase